MIFNLKLDVIDVDNEVFYNEVCYGLSKNEIHNELRIVGDSICFSPRLFLRSIGINDKFIELYFKRLSKTKSKRIKNKYNKFIYNRMEFHLETLYNHDN